MCRDCGYAMLVYLPKCEDEVEGNELFLIDSSVSSSAVRLFLNTVVSGKVTRKGKVKLVDSLNELGRDISLSR